MTDLTLTLKPPSEDTPGYVDRLERAMDFMDAINKKQMTGTTVRQMLDFLADYIDGDRELTIKALRQATQKEFTAMLNAVSGESAQVPPVPSGG